MNKMIVVAALGLAACSLPADTADKEVIGAWGDEGKVYVFEDHRRGNTCYVATFDWTDRVSISCLPNKAL